MIVFCAEFESPSRLIFDVRVNVHRVFNEVVALDKLATCILQ